MPFFLIYSVGGRGLLTKTSLRLAADALSCALPRVPHFGRPTVELYADRTPLGRVAEVREMASAVLFLASDNLKNPINNEC